MNKVIITLLTGTALALAAPAFAQDKSGSNITPGAEAKPGAVADVTLAQQLYAYGVANEDALAVANAAKILASVTLKEEARETKTEAREGAEAETGEGVDAPVTADDMYAAAMKLGEGDAALTGLIEDMKAEGSRGQIGGATSTLSRLPAGYYDTYQIPYYGGQFAELAVAGDGDADLDLVVTDESGNVICADQSYSDQLYCSWTPLWDGYFYVRVDNMGRVRNSYYLITN